MRYYQAMLAELNGSPAARALRVLLAVLELADFYQGTDAMRPALEAAFQGSIDALASSASAGVVIGPQRQQPARANQ
jgi:hypothetical protein